MKNTLILFFLSLLFSCNTNNNLNKKEPIGNSDYENIIGNKIKIGNLEFAEYDFPNTMDWKSATKACNSLGKGWRLPNEEELNILYENKSKMGAYKYDFYWSQTNVPTAAVPEGSGLVQPIYLVVRNFLDGSKTEKNFDYKFYVRAICDPNYMTNIPVTTNPKILETPSEIIGTPIIYNNLIFAENDFPNKMNWYDAKKACDSLGEEWRMFTRSESNQLNTIKDNTVRLKFDFYWTLDEDTEHNELMRESAQNIDTNEFSMVKEKGSYRKQSKDEYVLDRKMSEKAFNTSFCVGCVSGPQFKDQKYFVRAVKNIKNNKNQMEGKAIITKTGRHLE
jgi:hypothetical protein